MNEELKPCPFCGGKRISVTEDKERRSWHCGCEDCGIFSIGCEVPSGVINAWNKRS